MGTLFRLKERLLTDGKITDCEIQAIRDYIDANGRLDLDDVRFLVNLLSEAREVCPEFDELFFPALKQVLLADGHVGPDEQFYLLKMLYSDGRIRPVEKQFLEELRAEARDVSPEFESLCETALAADSENWDVGGR